MRIGPSSSAWQRAGRIVPARHGVIPAVMRKNPQLLQCARDIAALTRCINSARRSRAADSLRHHGRESHHGALDDFSRSAAST